MKKVIPFTFLFFLMSTLSGQSIDLTFTAINNESYVQLDSIKVMNRSQYGDTTLYWPDTVLSLYFVGNNENALGSNAFRLFQNYPNPVIDRTNITINIPRKDMVGIFVTDILGRTILQTERVLDKGKHRFVLRPGSENLCFVTVQWQRQSRTIKIVRTGSYAGVPAKIEYIGNEIHHQGEKMRSNVMDFIFSPGDDLVCICYYDGMSSAFHDNPVESTSYTFQFATNIPCPGTPVVIYEGQVYTTVQIGSQCWLKENLNVGIMIDAPASQTNNDTIEKYCMANMSKYCDLWGGIYFWNEAMKYTFQSGARGICPEGFHIPHELDWQILEGFADSDHAIGDPIWQSSGWRGLDAGGKLKQAGTSNWQYPNTGAIDALGFTALPGGYFVQGEFWGPTYKGFFWTSGPPTKYVRNMDWDKANIRRESAGSSFAGSVRCIKD